MKNYKGFLLDLDGTMYVGTKRIDEACDFVNKLHEKGIPYLFVTNNSSRTPEQVAEKLRDFGIETTKDHVFTTSQATANYIYEQNPNGTVYVIGEEGIRSALAEKGLQFAEEHADFVVTGIDREITYEKLTIACLAVRNGATFISTNGDIAIPTERGLCPGNGSLTSVVTVSTQTQPIFIGKPEKIIMEQALQKLNIPKEDVIMIGDYYDTDIMAGINANIDTLLVYTGVTTKEMVDTYEKKPTYTAHSLKEWMGHIG